MTKKNEKTNGKANAGEIDLPDIAVDPTVAALEQEIAAAERKCNRLHQVEAELATLREKIRSMETERGRHTAILEAATEERRKFAFAATDGDDEEAQERLKRARAAQTQATLQLEDSQSAVDEGRRRFDALEAEQAYLMPNVSWRDALQIATSALAEAAQIDANLEPMIQTLAAHQEKLAMIKQLAESAGREQKFRTLGLRQFNRVFSTKMSNLWPLEFEKFRQYDKKSYSDILRSQIAAGIGVDINTEPAGEATEPTATIESREENAQA
ncbi:MAG: hypothetical protein HYY82_12160 [Deltaproteobacteria bacterium]|nr:hypothetical protein [Deltaproteobacteria bacterium]